MSEVKKRIVFIDFIKLFLTCMVVAHHAGQAYGNTGGIWLVSDEPKLEYLRPFFFFNAAYMMGFYFFISGYFTFLSLNNKSVKKYLSDRFFRLAIPLLFFIFCIFGPLHYLLNETKTNYLTFLLDLHFNKPPLSVGHLWFVASLLVYSLIYLAIIKLIKVKIQFSKTFNYWFPLIYLLFLIPINVWVRSIYPIDYWVTWIIPIEVAHIPQYLSLFLLGALFNKTRWLEDINPITGLSYFILGIIIFISKDSIYNQLPTLWSESIIESFLCVGLCLGVYTITKKLVHHMNPFLKFLSENSYGIYLFHLLIVIGLQMILTKVAINTNLKFIIVTFLGILLSAFLSWILRKITFLKKIL